MDFPAMVERIGLPLAALVILCLAIWKAARYAGDRLLGKPDGILTAVAARHVAFIDKLDAQTEMQTVLLGTQGDQFAEHATALREISEQLKTLLIENQNLNSANSTAKTNAGITKIADCLRKFASEWNVDISEELAELERIMATGN
jgi:hypothetical protein